MIEIKRTGIVRRASAFLLDAILLAVLATGFMWIISLICNFGGVQSTYREYLGAWEDYRKDYAPAIAEAYGFEYAEAEDGTVTVTKDGAPAVFDDLIKALCDDQGNTEGMGEAYRAYLALTESVPLELLGRQSELLLNLLLVILTVGTLLSYLILEFVVPVCLKNGQTVGKKIFGIALMRQDCVRVKTLAVFVRTIFGKYIVETMFPIFLVVFFFSGAALLSVILLAVLAIANVVLFFATRNRTPLHDLMAGTVAVDINLQEIFDSVEELEERKALLAKEEATKPTETGWSDRTFYSSPPEERDGENDNEREQRDDPQQ